MPNFHLMFLPMLFWLVVAHCVCDYPLQGDFLAKAKNHRNAIPGVPWWIALTAHSAIHAGAVALITGSIMLGIFEFGMHWMIDHDKCDEAFSFGADQLFHIAFKFAWAFCAIVSA